MNLIELLDNIKNINDYATATQNVSMCNTPRIDVSIGIVLALKKIKYFEIEYFNKCDENGVACLVFEGLLSVPPSKVWNVLAKELISLLQYWLEAIRKHLVKHSTRWWLFLKLILKFIKEIRLKGPVIPNLIVELTSECLFDLATSPRPDVYQREEILHCLNLVCSESGREIRFAMRTKFGEYFVKMASQMATSGYLPGQYRALECLMRWLVPRHDTSLIAAAADKWLPLDLFPLAAKNLFLNSNWINFFQSARHFLNIVNEANGLVTSVICRQVSIGDMVLINGTEKNESWLDFNASGKSMSVLLDPRMLEAFGECEHRNTCETLYIDNDITKMALLRRDSLGFTISLQTVRAPRVRPTHIDTGNATHVSIVVSSKSDPTKLDGAMRNTFGDKYQLMLDLDKDMTQSPQRSYNINKDINSESDDRFSLPVATKRRKHSGYIVRSKNAGALNSLTNASTSSILQLRDRLTELPKLTLAKEKISVCAEPSLSNVTELSEQDWRSVTTTKFQPYGICQRNSKPYKSTIDKKGSKKEYKSEGEAVKPKSWRNRVLSPVASDDNATSLLLVATINSTSDKVINETKERLSKSRDYQESNIVDLLIKEALEADHKSRDVSDSGINTDYKKSQESETIDDTPKEIKESRKRVPSKTCTVVSKSTTDDESNTEAINETPAYVSTRNTKDYRPKPTVKAYKKPFSAKTIEEFFSQHIAENEKQEVVGSSALAKKMLNETSSETSVNFDDNMFFMNEENEEVRTDVEENIFHEIAVIDCLNDILDKVVDSDKDVVKNCSNEKQYQTTKPKKKTTKRNAKPPINKTKPRLTKKATKLEQENIKKMSTIIEQKEEDIIFEEKHPESKTENVNIKILSPEKKLETCVDTETPFVRRKRKLYSPKNIDDEIQDFTTDQTSPDVPLSKIKMLNNTNTTAICYKELEQERKKNNIRLSRPRRSKTRVVEMPSPRTIKMDAMFENIKQIPGGNEQITLVNRNTDVYNFSSESDDDFKSKREVKKSVSTTTFGSSSTIKKGKKPSRAKSQSSCDACETYTAKTVKRKRKRVAKGSNKRVSGANISAAVDIVGEQLDLVDERMREAVREELNTSAVIEQPANSEPTEIEPAIKVAPQMEEIHESVPNDTSQKITKETYIDLLHCSTSNDTVTSKKRVNKRSKKTEIEQTSNKKTSKKVMEKVSKKTNKSTELLKIKKEKGLQKRTGTITVSDKDDEGTVSPLPGLVVESMPAYNEDINDSLMTNMLQKFKKLYRDGPDVINDSINTQNMLSDVEKFNHSAQNYFEDDVYYTDGNKENLSGKNKTKKRQKPVQPKIKNIKNKLTELNNEVIETTSIDENCNRSNMPIATVHEDFDEISRETQDINESLRDHFNKLTRVLNNSESEECDSSKYVEREEVSTILCKEVGKTGATPPVVPGKRLLDDISKWIPSRRTSDTDSLESTAGLWNQDEPKDENSANANQPIQSYNNSAETAQKPALINKRTKTSSPESINLKSPTAHVTRLSSAEIEKWLPMPKNLEKISISTSQKGKSSGDLKLVYRTRSKAKTTTEVEAKTIPKQIKSVNTNKSTKETAKPMDVEIDLDHFGSNATNKQRLQNRSITRKTKTQYADDSDTDKIENPKDSKIAKTTRSSTIKKREMVKELDTDIDEPVIPCNTKHAKTPKTLENKIVTDSPTNLPAEIFSQNKTESSDDELLKTIRSRFTRARKTICSGCTKAEDTQKPRILTSKSIESIEESSPMKRKLTSPVATRKKAKITDEIHKEPERIYEPNTSRNIKQKIQILEDVVITPSGSTVNDWFTKVAQSDHDPLNPMKDTIDNIMEKLNTTTVVSNQNMRDKFVKLFVDLQKSLNDVRDEQRTMYKEAAKGLVNEMVSSIVSIVDKQFSDLETKSKEMSYGFMEKFKKQVFDLIREDCQQKRAMVLILKEDMQAVIDHIAYSKRTSSP